MSSKRKFKRDYIILEAKDINFRNKERVLPKAFAKVEVNEDKSNVALYVENLKYVKDGYDTMAITTKYDTYDLGKIVLSEQGKGEFVLDLDGIEDDIKSIAIVYEDKVPLIGFKGSKLENYEDLLFVEEEYDDDEDDEYEEYEEYDEDEEYEEYDEEEENEEGYDEYEEVEEGYEEEYVDNAQDFKIDNDFLNNQATESDEPVAERIVSNFKEVDTSNYDENFDEYEEDDYEYSEEDDFEFEDDDFYDNVDDDDFERIDPNSEQGNIGEVSQEEMVELNNFNKVKYREKYIEDETNDEEDPIKYTSNRKKVKSKNYKNSVDNNDVVEEKVEPEPKLKEDHKTAGTLMMPRQIKKGLKYFKEVKPFTEEPIENTRWWKIDINPTTLCGYSMPNLGYVNALNYTMYSDIVVNSYKHRHYLFGVQYDEFNKRKNYIYAIPGAVNEKPDNGSTGFMRFCKSDVRSKNSGGYWMCFIDARMRNIIKE